MDNPTDSRTIAGIVANADLDDEITTHVLRHSIATTLVRASADLVSVAELLGHACLENTRGYARPTAEDRVNVLDGLVVDR